MIIDGKAIALEITNQLKDRVSRLPFKPVFCDLLVGDDAVQRSYVAIKGRVAQSIGLAFSPKEYPLSVSTDELISEIAGLNALPDMSGLIVQLPLPASVNTARVLQAIDPQLDVDCIGEKNNEAFYAHTATFAPPTAAAIMRILDSVNLDYADKQFLVLGQGPLVGRPVTHLLTTRGYRVAVADRSTPNTHELLKSADVVISGVGQAGLVTGQDIKPGSVIIDAGTSETDGGIKGDVDFESVARVAAWVSPVPGGVGPVTVAELLRNVVTVAETKAR